MPHRLHILVQAAFHLHISGNIPLGLGVHGGKGLLTLAFKAVQLGNVLGFQLFHGMALVFLQGLQMLRQTASPASEASCFCL